MVDTDGDGLSDFEEVNGTTIYVANTHDSALNFMNAVMNGGDPTQYLTSIKATSNPKMVDTDTDGIRDGDEMAMGTNPNNSDTDGDHIPDILESLYGEDPTIFDITPPVITYDGRVWKDPGSINVKYDFDYGASDPGGVKDLSLLKNGIRKDGHTYPASIYAVSEHVYFETDWESFLDALRGAQVTINADDQNGNSESVLAYHRSSQFGLWAAQLGSNTIYGETIAGDLGMLSGGSAVVAQTSEFAVQFGSDPVGYLNDMKNFGGSIVSDPVLLGQLVASLPQSVKDEEELENPYAVDDPLHARFSGSYYSGYIAMTLVTIYLGNEVLKCVTSSEQFARLTGGLASKMDKLAVFLRASSRVDSFALFLADDSGSLGLGDFADLFAKLQTMGKKASFEKTLEVLQGRGISDAVIRGYLGDISKIKDVKGSDKFVTKLIQDKSVDNFKSLAWEADRAAYYSGLAETKSLTIEPIKQIDLKVVLQENGIDITKYIDQKKPTGDLTDSSLKNFIDSGQDKFGSSAAKKIIKTGDITKLEIDASGGLGINRNEISDTINEYMTTAYHVDERPDNNLINEVEIFFDDGNTMKGVKNVNTGVFDWT